MIKYKLYYFDSYGVSLNKLLRDRIFNSLEEINDYIDNPKPKHIENRFNHDQIVICRKTNKWEIFKII